MKLPLFQVDAFTTRRFGGNPAAVCPLSEWIPDALMQSIALENNLSETAYFVREGDGFRIRWFTPSTEIDLCGHATLASAYVLCNLLEPSRTEVKFQSKSGELRVTKQGDRFTLFFPRREAKPVAQSASLSAALGRTPKELYKSRDYLAVFDHAEDVRTMTPDMTALEKEQVHAVIVTAPGDDGCDFVSRFFAPSEGIPEDPVTGSAHCTLTPYWSQRLGKKELFAKQVSARGGELHVKDAGETIEISGSGVLYLRGEIEV